jgi:hypothetical protein
VVGQRQGVPDGHEGTLGVAPSRSTGAGAHRCGPATVRQRRARGGGVSGRRRRYGAPRQRWRDLGAPGSEQVVRHSLKKKGDNGAHKGKGKAAAAASFDERKERRKGAVGLDVTACKGEERRDAAAPILKGGRHWVPRGGQGRGRCWLRTARSGRPWPDNGRHGRRMDRGVQLRREAREGGVADRWGQLGFKI